MKDLSPVTERHRTTAGATLATVALQRLGDATRFREVADANLDILDPEAVFGVLESQLDIKIPNLATITRELPIFGRISEATNKVRALTEQGRDFVSQGQAIVGKLGGILPDGYTQGALNALGEVNGAFDQVESVLDQASTDALLGKLREYAGDTQLIDWLLS